MKKIVKPSESQHFKKRQYLTRDHFTSFSQVVFLPAGVLH
jgi:hypothetical protein